MARAKRKGDPAGRRTSAPERPRTWPRRTIVAAALIVLNLVVYAQVRHFEFVNWDDPTYITENPNVQEGLTRRTAKWALVTAHSPYWHPVTWLSHLLDVRLFGLDAGAHHVVNLVFHAGNTLLLYALLCGMTGAAGRSAFVAALFAVHPLHVESVAWVTERKDVLSTLFLLLTLAAYRRYVAHPGWRRYALVAVLFALALMAKPMVVTAPLVLLLLDWWPMRRVAPAGAPLAAWRGLIVEKIPLLVLALSTAVATVVVQSRVGAMASLAALAWHERLANAVTGYVSYLGKTIWPRHLAAFYPYQDVPLVMVVAACVLLAAISAAAFVGRHRYPYLLVGWCWFLVTLAPVIGLLQAGEQRIADRFMYVPIVGLLIVVAWGVPDLLARLVPDRPAGRRVALMAAAIAVVAACAAAARAQTAHWSDSLSLWRHATTATPDSYIAFENLGQALRERGQLEEAYASYSKALDLTPPRSPAYAAVIHNSRGLVLTQQGRIRDSIAEFDAAVRLNPAFAEPHNNLGNTLAAEGRFEEAARHYREAVRLKPDFAEAHVGLGGVLLSERKAADAIPHYREAIRLDARLAQAHNGLGAALAQQGQVQEAMARYEAALRLRPDLVTAHYNLAVLLVKQGRLDEAQRHLGTALTIDPRYEPAHQLWLRLKVR